MGRFLLVWRLSVHDLGRRRSETALLLVAIVAATATLTLGLVLHGATTLPYQQTRAATAGPDVVASNDSNAQGRSTPADLAALNALVRDPGVIGHSGPYPVAWTILRTHDIVAGAQVEGRDPTSASVDQPKVTQGSWVRTGGAVVERTFAEALDITVGDTITLNRKDFKVVGIAVTAAFTPYPQLCNRGCTLNTSLLQTTNPGLLWLTRSDARNLASLVQPLTYFLNLKLDNPSQADAFVSAYGNNFGSIRAPYLTSWQQISQQDGNLIRKEQILLLVGSWLLGVLAVASVAVLVGGRMVEEIRRVGLLKTVGGTPAFVAVVLLAEYLILALIAAAAGLTLGWLVAPLLSGPSAALLGSAGASSISVSNVEVVLAVALAVAVAAALVPAMRAAHKSTIRALTDSSRVPRRRAWLIALSGRLPTPLLLGMRIGARRPRRVVLCCVSVAVTVSGIVAVLVAHANYRAKLIGASSNLADPQAHHLSQVMLVITIMLVALASVNVIFIAQATALDAKQSSAVMRSLGATPGEVTIGLCAAQVLPALVGSLFGIPGGFALYALVRHGDGMTIPPLSWLLAVVFVSVVATAGLTAVPARIGARRPVAEILQSQSV